MTLAVLLLWGCVGLEKVARAEADHDARIALAKLESLRRRVVPVSMPVPGSDHSVDKPFHSRRPSVS